MADVQALKPGRSIKAWPKAARAGASTPRHSLVLGHLLRRLGAVEPPLTFLILGVLRRVLALALHAWHQRTLGNRPTAAGAASAAVVKRLAMRRAQRLGNPTDGVGPVCASGGAEAHDRPLAQERRLVRLNLPIKVAIGVAIGVAIR